MQGSCGVVEQFKAEQVDCSWCGGSSMKLLLVSEELSAQILISSLTSAVKQVDNYCYIIRICMKKYAGLCILKNDANP